MSLENLLVTLVRAAVRAFTAGPPGAALTPHRASPVPTWDRRPRRELNERELSRLTRRTAVLLAAFINTEFSWVDEADRLAAVHEVTRAFAAFGPVGADELFDADLEPDRFAERVGLRAGGPAMLSAAGTELYRRLLTESCAHVVQWLTEQRFFGPRTHVELVRRLGALSDQVRRLAPPPADVSDQVFARTYATAVAHALDRLELFGVAGRPRYPMSAAYLSLSVAHDRGGGAGSRVEQALAGERRVLLRGEAGSGKTTLLQWLAVRASRSDFDGDLADWNGMVPFFLPLRRFVHADLPAPDGFLSEVGRNHAGEMPDGWVHRMLRVGRALVLVDGVDELPPDERARARTWLGRLVHDFPAARYVVTSRPAAAGLGWLAGEGFTAMELLPMGLTDVREFLRYWHRAVGEAEGTDLATFERNLAEQIPAHRQLRQIATNPLLCAMLCALHRDRRMHLPRDRMELYAAALDMLLVRRDAEREVTDTVGLSRRQKQRLLEEFAYWLLRNGRSDASFATATEQFGRYLVPMRVDDSAEEVFRHLRERSGLLRHPTEGRVDFVHRTFLEYLAAAAAVNAGDLDVLVLHAEQDQWAEVVVMAVGHARPGERATLLRKLLRRKSTRAHLLAAASLEVASELDTQVEQAVRRATASLIPPRRISDATALAAAGEFVLGLLPTDPSSCNGTLAAATVRTAALIGGQAALALLGRYAEDSRAAVHDEILRARAQFPPDEFARVVLSRMGWLHVSAKRGTAGFPLQDMPALRFLQFDGLTVNPGRLALPAAVQYLTLTACTLTQGLEALPTRPDLLLRLLGVAVNGVPLADGTYAPAPGSGWARLPTVDAPLLPDPPDTTATR